MIPNSVTVLGNSAFRGSGLEKLKFAAGSQIESLGVQTFEECAALKRISIPKTVETLDFASFDSSGLENITFDVTSLQPDRKNLVFFISSV